ncbi:ribokinase [Aquibacillus saliphilus]|uniref:ribokinase n=1 Tax=Aquibacillus saliphilus TaxID=1909422 RepID=UPI001CF0054E|nr:ribokinase [Aquibacillus saliphilus]
MSKIAVIGSLNMDYIIETNTFPEVGETVLGSHLMMTPGGKGGNQAVAASRLGGDVSIFGSVGDDSNGSILKEIMTKEKVDISYLQELEDGVTGVAFIEVSNSNNRIIVIPGTNRMTNKSYIQSVEKCLEKFDVFIFQFETPLAVIEYLLPTLYRLGKKTIVNPAPALKLDEKLIEMITYLTPNEHEVYKVLDSNKSIDVLLRKYPEKLIVTMGASGVAYSDGKETILVPSMEIIPVDSTGAGDTFTGAFSVAIAEGKDLYNAIHFANKAAGLSIMKPGAQAGMPFREELEKFVTKEGIK